MNTLVVVPARGGSNGCTLKNLRKLAGKSLVRHAIECAYAADLTEVVVSSDHMDILKEAVNCGATAHIRPAELSTGKVGDTAVLRDVVAYHRKCETVVMLQPTAPLRRPGHIIGALSMLKDEDLDAVWTVSQVPLKYHPLKQLELGECGLDIWDERGLDIICRQQLTPTYYRNGAAYVMTRDCLMSTGTWGIKWGGYVIDDEQVSIDTEDDLKRAEELISGRHQDHRPELAHSGDR